MCGITGFIDFSRKSKRDFLLTTARRMTDTIVHRGPDDEGLWSDERFGVALGFRRLAILDLSPLGRQPMTSADGRFVLVFNGEIYNFPELREELENLGHEFKGHSDTEVILAAFTQWGIEPAVKKLNGMFAIAVWDEKRGELFLIRDRLGKKPLYYGSKNGTFFFGSELKTLRVHPDFSAEVDRDALALYLKFGYVPSPFSIYKGISKLAPGKMLRVVPEKSEISEQKSYWSITDAAHAGAENPSEESESELLGRFEKLLSDATRRRMLADVPLGGFLSGGIDSSTIVALMQANSTQPVKTFSIGFNEDEYNEAQHAKIVAEYLGTDHTELYVTPEEAQNVIPNLPQIYDEPFADSSQIPTYLVSALARRHVTVALSGDGGDEFFGGYSRYFRVNDLWNKLRAIPVPLRRAAASIVGIGGSAAGLVAPKNDSRNSNFAQKLNLLSEFMPSNSSENLYTNFVSHWRESEKIILTNDAPLINQTNGANGHFSPIQKMMLNDAGQYLPDDILVKVDRASMSVSLEVRAPFLDYRVAEFAWSLPMRLKIRDGAGKWIVKELLNKYVPREITNRPKMGFDVPINEWLRGSLRDWAENLLDENRLRREGFLNPAPIREKWRQHLSGKANNQQSLWTILMFQAWLENNF